MSDQIILETPKALKDQYINLYFENMGPTVASFTAGYNAQNDGLMNFLTAFQQVKLLRTQNQTIFDYTTASYHLKTANRIFTKFDNVLAIHGHAPSSPITEISMYPNTSEAVNVAITFGSVTGNLESQFSIGGNQIFLNAGFNNHLNDFINAYHSYIKNGTKPTNFDFIFRTNDNSIFNHLYIDIRNILCVILYYRTN